MLDAGAYASAAERAEGDDKRELPVPPLDLGKVIVGAYNVYRRHFAPLALMFILLYLPVMLFSARFGYVIAQMQRAAQAGRSPMPSEYEMSLMLGWLFALMVWFLLVFPFLLLVPARLAGLNYLGVEASFTDCLRYVRRHWWDTQASYALFGIIVIGLFVIPLLLMMLALIPGMEFVAIGLSMLSLFVVGIGVVALTIMVAPLNGAIAFDRPAGNLYYRARGYLTHTFWLARRHFWHLLGILIVAWMLMMLFRFMVARPLEIIVSLYGVWQEAGSINLESVFFTPPPWVATVQLVVGTFVGVLVLPFEQAVTGLAYFDLRGREEGLDLLVNAARMTGEEDILDAVAEQSQL